MSQIVLSYKASYALAIRRAIQDHLDVYTDHKVTALSMCNNNQDHCIEAVVVYEVTE